MSCPDLRQGTKTRLERSMKEGGWREGRERERESSGLPPWLIKIQGGVWVCFVYAEGRRPVSQPTGKQRHKQPIGFPYGPPSLHPLTHRPALLLLILFVSLLLPTLKLMTTIFFLTFGTWQHLQLYWTLNASKVKETWAKVRLWTFSNLFTRSVVGRTFVKYFSCAQSVTGKHVNLVCIQLFTECYLNVTACSLIVWFNHQVLHLKISDIKETEEMFYMLYEYTVRRCRSIKSLNVAMD